MALHSNVGAFFSVLTPIYLGINIST